MDADVIVAGAGCAGVSLAVHMQRAGLRGVQVLLLDPREHHARDRTWCYWPVFDHPFDSAVAHTWFRWRVLTERGGVERGSPSLGYRYLPSDRFFDLADELLGHSPNVRLARGVSVESFRHAGDAVVVATSEGEMRCRLAFDGRPPPRPEGATQGEIDWVQHFVGLEVETERSVFDPAVATLMDFRVSEDPGDIRFIYVLPLDRRHALLEDTCFGGSPRSQSQHVASIATYLEDRLRSGSWRETRREVGAIPMTTIRAPDPVSPRVSDIGVRAGMARPSTGYAFLAIQRQSAELAQRMAANGLEPIRRRRPYRRATTFLDRVFLAYLERDPAAAPGMFRRMFAGVDPERLARFMFDGGTVGDRAAVMRALPSGPLMRQALTDLGPNLRDTFWRT